MKYTLVLFNAEDENELDTKEVNCETLFIDEVNDIIKADNLDVMPAHDVYFIEFEMNENLYCIGVTATREEKVIKNEYHVLEVMSYDEETIARVEHKR